MCKKAKKRQEGSVESNEEEEIKKFSLRHFTHKQKKILEEVFLRVVIVSSLLQIISIGLYSSAYFLCLFFTDYDYVNLAGFGDCNNEKLYIYLLQVFFIPFFLLSILSAVGYITRNYALIMPYVAIRGVFCTYQLFGIITVLGKEEGVPLALDALYVIAECVVFVADFNAFLYIRGQTNIVATETRDYT